MSTIDHGPGKLEVLKGFKWPRRRFNLLLDTGICLWRILSVSKGLKGSFTRFLVMEMVGLLRR